MSAKGGTKKDLLRNIGYLQDRINQNFDKINELNKRISTLKNQIRAMGGEPCDDDDCEKVEKAK